MGSSKLLILDPCHELYPLHIYFYGNISTSVVETSKGWTITPDEVQVSYDVVNLYPSVPVKEAIYVIIEILAADDEKRMRTKLTLEDIRLLIELCLSKCYFIWEDKIYLLQNSGPIGLALMVVVAEAFLQYHERNAISVALQRNPPVALKSFKRYVDDSHARFINLKEAKSFQNILNEQNDNIKYTMEIQDMTKSLQFLDLNIQNCDRCYKFKIHRKNAITNVHVKPHSGHDPKILKVELTKIESCYRQKRNEKQDSTYGQQQQGLRVVSLPWVPGLSPKLRKSFRKAGYKTVIKSSAYLQTILTSQMRQKICQGDEVENCSCNVGYDWDTAKMLKQEFNKFDRKVREALEIQFQDTSPRSEHGLNLDDGQYVTTKFWKPMFAYLKRKSLQ
ncbi:uncharacterized protein LOC130657810 [Hydractinia symbiolongicarpus]|uniref:uncharacterized protein LOC130657810 n=1 Tax=Hydractinia symbiolongicarpus TaxID=13093 RepID=UPI00254D93E5|nr:uncharacterized protein LOC130657810 [Hydractinia symbiolongicarpus]